MRKHAFVVLMAVAIVATSVLATAPEPAHARVQSFRKIGHSRTYDVVRGHHRTLVVYHSAKYVKWHGARRYQVVQRRRRAVILRTLRTANASSQVQVTTLGGAPVSVGKPSSASSVSGDATADRANDGRQDTRWTAMGSPSYPQWWMVDLGQSTCIEGLTISWCATRRAYSYRIETSLDGFSFTTAINRSRNRTKGTTVDAFFADARYVRVTVLGVTPSGVTASAYEVTVNGQVQDEPTPGPEPTPTSTPTPTPADAHAVRVRLRQAGDDRDTDQLQHQSGHA